jgi:hypothetical protein
MVSYPPQGHPPGGYQSYGPPPYGHGQYPDRPAPTTAPAYVSATVFLVCGALALMLAIIGWNGSSDNPDMIAALVGVAFTDDLTGNADFAISTTMTVACTTLTFALVLFSRLGFARWVLAFVGGVVTLYYLYAVIWLLSNDAGEVISMTLVSWVLWLTATVLVLLPHTGRAMRGRYPRY